MKKQQLEKIESGIATLLAIAGWSWCEDCKLWDKMENFTEHHNHQTPNEEE